MMSNLIHPVLIGCFVTLALLLSIKNKSYAEVPLKIGVIIPLSGPNAKMGIGIQHSLELRDPIHLKFQFEDDECTARKALSAYNKLVQEGIQVFFVGCSGSVLALAPLARQKGHLILASSAGSTTIRETGSEVIRFNPDAMSVADKMAQEVAQTTFQRLGLLYEEQDYSSSLATALSEKLGSRIVLSESYPPTERGFRTLLTRFRAARIDALIFVPVAEDTARTVYQDFPVIGKDLPLIGEVNVCDFPVRPSAFGIHGFCTKASFRGPAMELFEKSYQERYKEPPQFPFYEAITFDIATVLEKILSAPGMAAGTVEQIKAEILRGSTGAITSYSFTPDGEVLGGDYLHAINF